MVRRIGAQLLALLACLARPLLPLVSGDCVLGQEGDAGKFAKPVGALTPAAWIAGLAAGLRRQAGIPRNRAARRHALRRGLLGGRGPARMCRDAWAHEAAGDRACLLPRRRLSGCTGLPQRRVAGGGGVGRGRCCCLRLRWRCGGPRPRQSPGPDLFCHVGDRTGVVAGTLRGVRGSLAAESAPRLTL
ncbi:hypothetical_protein_-_conserved [Leishmania infantum]|uniref:Hypothetical_protein_-_conserved n=1 Tax=Leishmania infantum TaxID=5671 RepID=A0A6L0XC64_LEIIN|nr:hypothetical_protein_-_conserved [Leishmania infantum]SUZ41041.1 hypothetical_protein_-_conserved [Leishmania infantum]